MIRPDYSSLTNNFSNPLWRKTAQKKEFPRLQGEYTTDVVVIGGGITGITTAWLLKQEGLKVAVLEALTIGAGTTGCTTAHFTQVGDLEFTQLVKNFSREDIRLTVNGLADAMLLVESLVQLHNIDCGFRRLNAYWYTENSDEIQMLKDEYEESLNLDMLADMTSPLPLPFPAEAVIRYPSQAHFHTLKFIFRLAELLDDGLNLVFEKSRATSIEGDGPYIVHTEEGTIEAQKVIFATHTPLMINPVQLEMVPGRSYVVGVKVDQPEFEDALYWDNEDPYHYICRYDDYVIIGGADHKQGEDIDENEYMIKIEQWARKRFNVTSVEFKWSGQEFTPADGLPYIGKSPFAENIYIATGFSGNGISYGVLAAMMLTDVIAGRENPLSEIMSPSRFKPLAGYKTIFEENAGALKSLITERMKIKEKDVSTIMPGTGDVIKYDGKNTAVYRDMDGNLHRLSPTCRHAGCMVKWNDFEKSWDCQCHGARYFPDGRIMEGPQLAGLEEFSDPTE